MIPASNQLKNKRITEIKIEKEGLNLNGYFFVNVFYLCIVIIVIGCL